MLSDTFGMVLRIVKDWHPKKDCKSEPEYRDDLLAFIRKELKRMEERSIWGIPQKHRIRKESGRHLADIGIDEKIGIELKRNFISQRKYDTLIGQMKRFKRAYGNIIVVLCGRVRKELVDDLRVDFEGVSGISPILGSGTVVEIVDKGKHE